MLHLAARRFWVRQILAEYLINVFLPGGLIFQGVNLQLQRL